MGVVAREAREDLGGFVVVGKCVLRVIKDTEVFVEVGVADGIWDVVFSHLFRSDLDGSCVVLLKRDSLALADQNLSIFLVNTRKDDLTMHVVDLPLSNLLDNRQLSQRQVMFELSVEDLHLLETDIHVVRVVHHYVIVLLRVDLQQGVSEDFEGFLNMPE